MMIRECVHAHHRSHHSSVTRILFSCHNHISLTTQIPKPFPTLGLFPDFSLTLAKFPDISRLPGISRKVVALPAMIHEFLRGSQPQMQRRRTQQEKKRSAQLGENLVFHQKVRKTIFDMSEYYYCYNKLRLDAQNNMKYSCN